MTFIKSFIKSFIMSFVLLTFGKKSTRNKRKEMIMKTLTDFINEMQIENLTVDNINRYLKLYGLKPIQK